MEQTLREIEIICVDDASDDLSPSILEEYARLDARLIIIRHEHNQYAGVARNSGLCVAKGKYVVFRDADDFFEPDALKLMYLQCEKDEADVCVCGGRIYDMVTQRLVSVDHYLNLYSLPRELPFSSRNYPQETFGLTSSEPFNKMFRTEYIVGEGLQFQAIQRSNDKYFVFMAIALAQRIPVVDQILVNYRRGTTTSLQETSGENPFCFYESLLALRQGLIECNLFRVFKKGFIACSLYNCIYNLQTQKTKDAWLRVALRLRGEICKELGCSQHSEKFFPVTHHQYYEQMIFLLEKSPEELAKHEPKLRIDERGKTTQWNPDLIKPDGSTKISVIIPIYNTEKYLEECVRSVMRQTLHEIEIICVDDGSSDSTPIILERLRQEDGRIRLLWQENAGQSVARNYGMREACGEYIAFLDSDDMLAWCALEHSYREAKQDDLDMLFFEGDGFYDPVELFQAFPNYRTYYRYKESSEFVCSGQELFLRLRESNNFRASVCMQLRRRVFLEENQIAFYPGIVHQDELFTQQSLMFAKRTKVLNEPLYLRRIRPDSIMTRGKNWKDVYGCLICIHEAGKSLAFMETENDAFIKAILKYQIQIGQSAGRALRNLSENVVYTEMAMLPFEEKFQFTILLEFIRQQDILLQRDRKQKKLLNDLHVQLELEKKKLQILQKPFSCSCYYE